MFYSLLIIILLAVLAFLLWPIRNNSGLCLKVAVLFFVLGLGTYQIVGAPEIVPLLAERDKKLEALKTSITSNSEVVKKDSKNLKAWVALGDDFMQTGQYKAAANAYKQSVLLTAGNPLLILSYARATILSEEGKVGDHAKKSLEMVLLQQPENAEAKYFLTMRKLQDGNTQEAMKDMKALYASLPADSPLKAMIDRQIGR